MTRPTVLAWGMSSCVGIRTVEKTFCGTPGCLLLLLCLPPARKGENHGFGLRMAKCAQLQVRLLLGRGLQGLLWLAWWWDTEPSVLQPEPWGPV